MRKLAIAGLVLASASPAYADWQGFEWRMSEEQVETAVSPVEVYRLEEVKRKNVRTSVSTLGGNWTNDDQDYQLFFYFDSEGQLEFIEIEPQDVDCAQRNDVLADQFGKYEEEVKPLGPAQRVVRYWKLDKLFELNSLVIHFENSDTWMCTATIRNPTPWLDR